MWIPVSYEIILQTICRLSNLFGKKHDLLSSVSVNIFETYPEEVSNILRREIEQQQGCVKDSVCETPLPLSDV